MSNSPLSNFVGDAIESMRANMLRMARSALPQRCELCASASGSELVCRDCARRLPRLGPACPMCALPVEGAVVCGRCLAAPPSYERTRAAFSYSYPVDRLLHAFKYHGRLALAHWCAHEMLAAVEAASVRSASCRVVAMPLSAARQRERGFNQALEIARLVCAMAGLALAGTLVRRVHANPPQAALPWSERAGNVRGAFACERDLGGLDIIVIDDVMTTGASLEELARTLKQAGARSVENWLVARTLPPSAS